MPYGVRKQGNKFFVYKKSNNKSVPGGGHATEGEAQKHLAALETNVGDAKSKRDDAQKRTDGKRRKERPQAASSVKKTTSGKPDYKWKGRD